MLELGLVLYYKQFYFFFYSVKAGFIPTSLKELHN